MSATREATPGATRTCPHCRARILESASVCPGCRHHLRFDPGAATRALPTFSALHVDGTIRHPAVGEPWEYSVVVSVRNAKGEELSRHVVGIGALHPHDERTFTLSVDVFTPGATKGPDGRSGTP